jgi:diguanylate cyclase (GGDEF)-like protein
MGSIATVDIPDLFEEENQALLHAQNAYACCAEMGATACRQALGDLLVACETRRLVRHSDRAELEMNRLNVQLQALAEELEHRASHDPLTQVLNRAAIIGLVNQHLEKADLSLIVLDIDYFKRINDSFGHPTGDKVILGVVTCLKAMMPACGFMGRVGGEEFTVVLPRQSVEVSEQLAHDMRRAIEGYEFNLPDGSGVTASFGVSWASRGGDFDRVYGLADQALYIAKRGGRNQISLAL